MDRLKGLRDLIFDSVEATTNLVEKTHLRVTRRAAERVGLLPPLEPGANAVAAVHGLAASSVYATIRAVNRGVGYVVRSATDPVLDALQDAELTSLATSLPSDRVDDARRLLALGQSALNGLYGNHLAERGNGLDLGMTFRVRGEELEVTRENVARAFPEATKRIAVFVHGLSCTEWSWSLFAERYYGDASVTFGSKLQAELGYTPFYVRYNTGRHVSENGRQLALLIERLMTEYPVGVEEIVLIGHSMGGLVSRSAAHYGREYGHAWSQRLKHIFCLGSPHLGAPLEKGTHMLSVLLQAFPTAGTEVPAALLNSRSSGIKDLRYGYTLDEEWRDRDPDAALEDHRRDALHVDGVGYYFLAATITTDPNHPAGILLGDVLVRTPSAAGRAPEPDRHIPFHSGRVFGGMHHFHLASHPEVYAAIRQLLASNYQATDSCGT